MTSLPDQAQITPLGGRRRRISTTFETQPFVSQNPDAGEKIPGTGGARKLRIPFKGKGKGKGARVVTFYSGDDIPVFLLDLFSKGEKINLSKAERNQLKAKLSQVAEAYRESVRQKTERIGSAS